jgi:hypothetical protein
MQGKTPARPSDDSESFTRWGLNRTIWSEIEDCWARDPQERPTARGVSLRLPHPPAPFRKNNAKGRNSGTSKTEFPAVISDRWLTEVPEELIDMLKASSL